MSRRRAGIWWVTPLLVTAACQEPPPPAVPPGAFAFAALGDAPYSALEDIRFGHVMRQLDQANLSFIIHVGDIFWYPCSDEHYRKRLDQFRRLRHPLVYTPGDNEWTDCHERIAGSYGPLDRLTRLRAIFFASPESSLGTPPLPLAVQAADTAWSEFVEHVRWVHERVVFFTVHLVGGNGLEPFPGRSVRDDEESARRTAAAAAWTRASFAVADSLGAAAVVLALHANMALEEPADDAYRRRYEPFLETLEAAVERFAGPVLLIHGDDHEFVVDHPLVRRTTGQVLENLTRLEVPGSPAVGWVQVVVDAAAATPFSFASRVVPRWTVW